MFKLNWKHTGVIAGLLLLLIAVGCGSNEETTTDVEDKGTVNYSEEMNYLITGIEPGAGVFKASEKAVEEYRRLQVEQWLLH